MNTLNRVSNQPRAVQIIAAGLFVFTGGTIFQYDSFKKNKGLATMAATVALAMSFYFYKSIYADLTRNEEEQKMKRSIENMLFPKTEYGNSIHPNEPILSNGYLEFSQKEQEKWTILQLGGSANGFAFSSEGVLYRDGIEIGRDIPASYQQKRNGVTVVTAQRVLLSPPSPGGNYLILVACDESGSKGLCWSAYVVDFESERIKEIYAGKYGPDTWVKWSEDETYALLRYASHQEYHLYRVNLASGATTRVK